MRGSSPRPTDRPNRTGPTRTRRRTRAAARRAACSPRTESSPGARRRAACRTRGASCAPPIPGGTGRSPGNSSRRLPLAPELPEQGAHLGCLERLAVIARVVEEPAPGLGAELVPRDLLLDQPRRTEAVVAERLGEKPARAMQDVDPTPVDELEDADRRVAEPHAGFEGAVHSLGCRDAFFD